MPRRFKPPWTTECLPSGYVVKDATGQSLAYVYARETRADADMAKVRMMDESSAHRGEYRQAADALLTHGVALRFHASHVTGRIGPRAQPGHDGENGALGLLTSQVVACFHCTLVFFSRTKRLLFFFRLAVSARFSISLGVQRGTPLACLASVE